MYKSLWNMVLKFFLQYTRQKHQFYKSYDLNYAVNHNQERNIIEDKTETETGL